MNKYPAFRQKYYCAVRDVLVHVAREQSRISYKELAQKVGMPVNTYTLTTLLGELLCDINEDEQKEKRPMLSVLVVRSADRLPGIGIFDCAEYLGLLPANTTEDDELVFWAREKKRVYKTWSQVTERKS
ncbi:MAG: hypothetical protein OXF32_02325 [Anaerolineaceae bacterium]|nr:hypothetical protein [Anaerolineaceae bacterium]